MPMEGEEEEQQSYVANKRRSGRFDSARLLMISPSREISSRANSEKPALLPNELQLKLIAAHSLIYLILSI